MSRTLSLTMRQAMTGAETGETPVVLVEITHPDLTAPIRISSHPTERYPDHWPPVYGTTHQGERYYFVGLGLVWPDDQEGQPPSARMIFEAISQDQVALIRSMSGPATARIVLVLASSPDEVEAEYAQMLIAEAEYDAGQVSVPLTRDDFAGQPWPCDRMTRDRFPGLF